MKPNGVFISITFAQPHFRKPIYALDKYEWSIEQYTIGETFHYFVYVMTKGKKLSESDKLSYIDSKNKNQHYTPLNCDDINENYLTEIIYD